MSVDRCKRVASPTALRANVAGSNSFGFDTTSGLPIWRNNSGTVVYIPTMASATPDGTLLYAEVSLTNAEIKALRATPKTIIAAPASGKMIQFVSATLLLKAGTNVLTESTANLGFKYTNGSGVQVSETVECTDFIDQAVDTITNARPQLDAIVAKTGADAKALVLHNLGAGEFAGNAANDATMKVRVAYYIVATT